MKKVILNNLCLLVIFASANLFAFSQSCQWSSRIGEDWFEYAKPLAVDHEGNVYIGGITKSSSCIFNTDTLYTKGVNDMFLVKYSISGEENWIIQMGWYNTNQEEMESIGEIIIDTIRNRLLVCGTFYDLLSLPGLSLSGMGMTGFVLSLDLEGNVIWGKAISCVEGWHRDVPMVDIVYDEQGNVYVLGSASQTVSFDGVIVPRGGFLAKYDPDGNILWAKNKLRYWNPYPLYTYSHYTEAPATSLAYSDNKLFLNGYTLNDTIIIDTLVLFLGSLKTSYLTKFSSEGDLINFTHSGGPKCQSGNKIAIDDGSVYITGNFETSIGIFGQDTLISHGSLEGYLSKLNPAGEFIWTRQMYSNGEAWGKGLALDTEGGIYISGHFTGNIRCDEEIISSTSFSDMFLAKFSSEGNCIGIKKFSKGGPPAIEVDHDGNICMTGSFENTLEIGPNIFHSRGKTDIFAAKCSPITGIPQPFDSPSNELLIYANPNTGQCTLTIPEEFRQDKKLQLKIYNQSGRLIQATQVVLVGESVKLDISAQAKGIYLAILSNGKKNFQGKIVFE